MALAVGIVLSLGSAPSWMKATPAWSGPSTASLGHLAQAQASPVRPVGQDT